MADALGWFFSLGERVTKNDPKKLLDWNFYLMTIMFLAFFSILLDNLYQFFFISQRITNLGWAFVMLAILWFQYQGLKQIYDTRKMYKNLKPEKIGDEKSMLDEFKEPENKENTETKDELSEETSYKFNPEAKSKFD